MLYLSLCMIVKNEESVLKRCLDSVKGIVDEIVIADTGSTDNTVKIASEYTDYIYRFEWTDSFSDARNFVQNKANGKWILVLDADEFVDRNNLIDVRKKLMEHEDYVDAYFTTIYNFIGKNGDNISQHISLRIYRNSPDIKFIRAIHEQLFREDNQIRTIHSDLIIYHTGYIKNVVKNKNKNSRNTRLIEKQREKSRQTGFDYFNMGNEFLTSQQTDKALEYFQKAYLLKKDISFEWVPLTVVQIIICLITLKEYNEAIKVIDDNEKYWEKAPEFKYLRGQIFLDQNRLEDAKEHLNRLLDNKSRYNGFIKSVDFLELYPYMALGYIYEKEGNNSLAIKCYTHVLSVNKNNIEAFYRMLSILTKHCTQQEILSFIKTQILLDKNNQLLVIKILLGLFQCELSDNLINQLDGSIIEKDGMLLKLKMFKGEYSFAINHLKELNDDELNRILNEGFFDWVDLFLFYMLKKDPLIFSRIRTSFSDEGIIAFLQTGEIKSEADKNIFLSLLERSIKYQWFDLFESMVQKKYSDYSIDLAIGHLLCKLNFTEIALNFYESVGDIKLLDETALVNIVDYLIKQNDKETALQYALQAIELDHKDFRLFKFAIELLVEFGDEVGKNEILKLALKYYPGSNCTKRYLKTTTSNFENC